MNIPSQAKPDKYFYHVTTESIWLDILQSGGLRAGSYFAVSEIADYYAECIRDEGEVPFLIAVDYSTFQRNHMGLDKPGLAEPVCYSAFGLREQDVFDAWEQSDGTIDDCIALIGSFQYNEKIPLSLLKVYDEIA